MALVITVAQQKGGAGKTMLVANLAAWLATGKTVAALDIDPQGSLARWHRERARHAGRAPVTLEEVSGWRVAGALERLSRSHAVVLVDTPPVVDSDARRAIRAADLVLVPMQPSAVDLWAAEGTLRMAAEERRPVAVVLNRVPPAGRQLAEMEAALAARGLPVLPASCGNRAAFAAAFAQGLGVTESAPKTAAAREVRTLAAAMLAPATLPATP